MIASQMEEGPALDGPSPSRISIRHRGPAAGPAYETWREGIWRGFCRLDVSPTGDGVIDCRNEIVRLHCLAMATPKGTSARFARTRGLLSDGCDDLVLILASRGVVRVTQDRRTIDLAAGEMCLTEMNVAGAAELSETGGFTTARFPRRLLLQVFPAAENHFGRPLVRDGALRAVFDRYFALCREVAADLDLEAQKVAAHHLVELIGLMSAGAGPPARVPVRGLSAARLEVLKSYVIAHLDRGPLTVASVARANGLSERQAQRLFAQSGTTFSDYLLEQRLDLARRILLGGPTRKVSDIAYAAGFNDLSYFNRAFRRRFGVTPSDMRDTAPSRH